MCGEPLKLEMCMGMRNDPSRGIPMEMETKLLKLMEMEWE